MSEEETIPAQTPRSELAEKARQHYQELTDSAHSWMSVIPNGIRAWEIQPELLDALAAVVGHGYLEADHPAGFDYVSKSAIAKVREALKKAEKG